jgi:excisionase family DNA binding protein
MTHAALPPLRAPVPTTRLAYRPDEVALMVGVSLRSIRRWIAEGVLPASRVGRSVLVRARDVDALLTASKIGGADAP